MQMSITFLLLGLQYSGGRGSQFSQILNEYGECCSQGHSQCTMNFESPQYESLCIQGSGQFAEGSCSSFRGREDFSVPFYQHQWVFTNTLSTTGEAALPQQLKAFVLQEKKKKRRETQAGLCDLRTVADFLLSQILGQLSKDSHPVLTVFGEHFLRSVEHTEYGAISLFVCWFQAFYILVLAHSDLK